VLDASQVRVHPDIDGMLYPATGAPLVLAALILTLVCSNLANLTLARGAARRRDIAVRLAIGATRAQVMRSLTLESVLLALGGGVLGLLLAWWAVGLLGSWRAPLIDVAPVLNLDARAIAFAIGLSLVTGIAFGLLPALRASRTELRQAIGGDAGRAVRVRDVRGALIALQIAIGIVLLVGGGLLMRTMLHALRIDSGFDTGRLAIVAIDASQAGLPSPAARQLLLDVRDRVSSLGGVEGAALTTRAPVTRFGPSTSLFLDERSIPGPDGSRSAEVRFASITPEYFSVMGIDLVHGRGFGPEDNGAGAPVAIVSRAMAERFWGTSDVLGRRYRHEGTEVWITVVGVAGDVPIQSVAEPPMAFVYRPLAQQPSAMGVLVIRTAGDPGAVIPQVRHEVMALNSRVPVLRASTMTDYIGRSLALQRVVGTVIGWSAALAVVLACLGVYSVVAFTVSRRRTEMGLRMALGATRQQVTKLVLGEMSRLVAVGVVAGIAAAALASRILSGLLIGVSPLDPAAFAVATVVVASSALLTTWIPARRAASANPALELRAE
jgi:predicted permease